MNGASLLELLRNYGFPVAVSAWLLYWLPQMQSTLVQITLKLDQLIQIAQRAP